VQKRQIIVLSWDPRNEEITLEPNLPQGALEALHLAVCAGQLDGQLGPYPYTQLHLWSNISCLMSARVLERADCGPGTLIFPGDVDAPKEGSGAAVVAYFPGLARSSLSVYT